MKSDISKIIAVIVFLVLPIQAAIADGPKKIETIGTSRIYNKNFANAREKAIAAGLATAVNITALGQMPPERFAEKFEEIHSILYGNTKKFIRSYKILAESKSGDVYRVLVQATVSEKSVKDRLKAITDFKAAPEKLPKLLVFILETNSTDDPPVYWWRKNPDGGGISEPALEKTLKGMGFEFAKRALPEDYEPPESETPFIEKEDALRIGSALKADVLVIGKAVAEKSMNTMEDTIHTFRGTVNIRAYLTETGDEIAAASQNHVNVHQDEIEGCKTVLSEAAALAANEIASGIANGWKEARKKANRYKIFVGGTSYLGNFVLFRRGLMSMHGVKEIQLREMKSDEATILVDYKGSAREMADALMLMTFDTFGINLYEITESHLRIELVPK